MIDLGEARFSSFSDRIPVTNQCTFSILLLRNFAPSPHFQLALYLCVLFNVNCYNLQDPCAFQGNSFVVELFLYAALLKMTKQKDCRRFKLNNF